MPTKQTVMGYEGLIYYGPGGSTATTLLTNRRDTTLTVEYEAGDTTPKGDGIAIPIMTEEASAIGWSAEFTMMNKKNDAALDAMKTAANTGVPIAVRFKDFTGGKGYDGDVAVSYSQQQPLKGEQASTFTIKPNNAYRDPQLYV